MLALLTEFQEREREVSPEFEEEWLANIQTYQNRLEAEFTTTLGLCPGLESVTLPQTLKDMFGMMLSLACLPAVETEPTKNTYYHDWRVDEETDNSDVFASEHLKEKHGGTDVDRWFISLFNKAADFFRLDQNLESPYLALYFEEENLGSKEKTFHSFAEYICRRKEKERSRSDPMSEEHDHYVCAAKLYIIIRQGKEGQGLLTAFRDFMRGILYECSRHVVTQGWSFATKSWSFYRDELVPFMCAMAQEIATSLVEPDSAAQRFALDVEEFAWCQMAKVYFCDWGAWYQDRTVQGFYTCALTLLFSNDGILPTYLEFYRSHPEFSVVEVEGSSFVASVCLLIVKSMDTDHFNPFRNHETIRLDMISRIKAHYRDDEHSYFPARNKFRKGKGNPSPEEYKCLGEEHGKYETPFLFLREDRYARIYQAIVLEKARADADELIASLGSLDVNPKSPGKSPGAKKKKGKNKRNSPRERGPGESPSEGKEAGGPQVPPSQRDSSYELYRLFLPTAKDVDEVDKLSNAQILSFLDKVIPLPLRAFSKNNREGCLNYMMAHQTRMDFKLFRKDVIPASGTITAASLRNFLSVDEKHYKRKFLKTMRNDIYRFALQNCDAHAIPTVDKNHANFIRTMVTWLVQWMAKDNRDRFEGMQSHIHSMEHGGKILYIPQVVVPGLQQDFYALVVPANDPVINDFCMDQVRVYEGTAEKLKEFCKQKLNCTVLDILDENMPLSDEHRHSLQGMIKVELQQRAEYYLHKCTTYQEDKRTKSPSRMSCMPRCAT